MSLLILARDQATDEGFSPAPHSMDPLTTTLRRGLIAPAVSGLLSVCSTLALIVFILHRLMSWRRHYKTFIGYNQYVMLVLNLLIADLQQACAFVISWYWIAQDKIVAPSPGCFAQGWLLHSGDVSSAMFVLAIAVHTFCTAVLGWQIRNTVFYSCIIALWMIAYAMTAIGVGLHPKDYFVRAGAWCWVSTKYETERLFLHYLWVFLVEFSTIILYAVTFFVLRYKTRKLYKMQSSWSMNRSDESLQPDPKTMKAVNRVTRLMMLYPCVYILLTLPLSSGRMWSMARNGAATSETFSCTAGALLASCGWVDVLLYTLTRKRLLQDTMPRSGRKNSGTADNIISTKTVVVQDHGPLPHNIDGDADLFGRNSYEDDGMSFAGERPGNRISGCLIETPPSRPGSVDPMAAAGSKTVLPSMTRQYDWQEMLKGSTLESIEPGSAGDEEESRMAKGKKRLSTMLRM